MSSERTSGLVECSFVILAEKVSIKDRYIFIQRLGMMGKSFFDKKNSQQNVAIDKQKAVLTTGPTNFRRNDRNKSLNAQ